MAPYVDGVNIKLEKAGGIRSALIAIECAKKNNLKVWIGMMMSSVLGTNTAAHLIFASDLGGDLGIRKKSEKKERKKNFSYISFVFTLSKKCDRWRIVGK